MAESICRSSVAGLLAAMSAVAVAAGETERPPIDEIEVIGVTPTQSGGLDVARIAANVQTVTDAALSEQHALDVTEFMNRNMASVFINDAQNNPLQPDVQFRGFVASPLLGLPQGISVYQDGVRINEPFGDTVNWSLVPESAIASIDLIPGSNPLFGLNTLGGALSLHTKTGFSHPGSRAEISAGSFRRVDASVETGGDIADRFGYFATAAYFGEDGWRDFSPSEAVQFFGDLSYAGAAATVDLSLNLIDTELIGNGPAPVELLNVSRDAIYTRPDRTENRLAMLNLRTGWQLADRSQLSANVYFRHSDVDTLNGDDSDYEQCENPENAGFVCSEEDGEEQVTEDAQGNPIVWDASLDGAAVNRGATAQDAFGGALEFTFSSASGQRSNQFIIGSSFDSSRIDFKSSTELGALDETRLAVPGGAFVGDLFVALDVDVDHYGLYFTDTLSLNEALAVTLSARYNDSRVELRDQLGTALNGRHKFSRLNAGAGITYQGSPALGLYLGYSESNRIPSPVELTCADENDPCRLPNAFLADPPLEQVIGKSWEAGARGEVDDMQWHLGVFHTINENDIIFISAGAATNQGFFSNVGETVRRGIEANLNGTALERLDWFVNYTYLDATFEESLAFPSPNNPAAVDGEVFVRPGDRLPLVPDGMLKAGMSLALTPRLSLGVTAIRNEKMFYRGDEGNDIDTIPAYTVISLRGEYRLNDHVSLFAKVGNALDEDHETFGLFGEADEVLGDEFDDPRFLGPGAPRAAWIGVSIQ